MEEGVVVLRCQGCGTRAGGRRGPLSVELQCRPFTLQVTSRCFARLLPREGWEKENIPISLVQVCLRLPQRRVRGYSRWSRVAHSRFPAPNFSRVHVAGANLGCPRGAPEATKSDGMRFSNKLTASGLWREPPLLPPHPPRTLRNVAGGGAPRGR